MLPLCMSSAKQRVPTTQAKPTLFPNTWLAFCHALYGEPNFYTTRLKETMVKKTFYALVNIDHRNTGHQQLRALMAVKQEHSRNDKTSSSYHINDRDEPV